MNFNHYHYSFSASCLGSGTYAQYFLYVPISIPYFEIIKLWGRISFINSPDKRVEDPNKIHKRFSWKDNSTVFIDYPPYFTIVNWMIIVAMIMIKKRGLLKKCSKTLVSSGLSFLAFISLKTWRSTNTLKNIQ